MKEEKKNELNEHIKQILIELPDVFDEYSKEWLLGDDKLCYFSGILGESYAYRTRVFDSYTVTYCPQDVELQDVTSQFNLNG
jgi:hypothetical protein